jgi:hypothetical protein
VGPTATTDPSFRDLHAPEEIEELGQKWDALVASGQRASPLDLSSWVAAWLREFAADHYGIRVLRLDGRGVAIGTFEARKRLKRVDVLHRAYRGGTLRGKQAA